MKLIIGMMIGICISLAITALIRAVVDKATRYDFKQEEEEDTWEQN